jgi:hypothetical protein
MLNPSTIQFQSEQGLRIGENGDTVLAVSGERTRNRDYWSGKPFRIEPAGIRLASFNLNPVLLWMHHHSIPLGNVELYLDQGKVWGKNFGFHRKEIPLVHAGWASGDIGVFNTAVIADLWEEFVLNAVSISLDIETVDEPNIFETDQEFIIGSSEALELSIVTIPADRDALRQRMVSFGIEERVAKAMTCKDGICHLSLYDPSSIRVRGASPTDAVLSFDSTSQMTEGGTMLPEEEARQDDVLFEAEVSETEETTEEAVIEPVEEVVEETEVEETELELEVDMGEVIQALVADPRFINQLAVALAKSEVLVNSLAETVSENVEQAQVPRKVRLRFPVNTTAPSKHAGERTVQFNQEEAAPAKPKVRSRLGSLVKPRI